MIEKYKFIIFNSSVKTELLLLSKNTGFLLFFIPPITELLFLLIYLLLW